MNVNVLLGKTLVSVDMNQYRDEIVFTTDQGEKYLMHHDQDCCESVSIEDVCGDLQDLVGSPILQAEESSSDEPPIEAREPSSDEAQLWTFYKFATLKGYVTLRWYGTSNGYYSMSVDFDKLDKKQERW